MANGKRKVRAMGENRWTASMVEERMAEAAHVLRSLPEERVQGYFSTWPEVVRDFWDAFGWHDAVLSPARPSPTAIDRMDEAMTWLRWLDPTDAKIVWERAAKTRWKPICHRFGLARSTAWRHWVAGLALIAARLNGRRRLYTGSHVRRYAERVRADAERKY